MLRVRETRKQRLRDSIMTVIVEPSIVYKVCIECGRGEKHVSRRERDAGRGHYTGPYCVLGCTVRYGDTSTRVRWTGSDIYNNSQTCYGHGIFVLRIHSIHISRLDSFSISCPQFTYRYRVTCNPPMSLVRASHWRYDHPPEGTWAAAAHSTRGAVTARTNDSHNRPRRRSSSRSGIARR